jgi:hypothetical protein
MFSLRIALGMKKRLFCLLFKHMIKVYSNFLEISIDRGDIINQDKFKMYTIRKPNNLFSKRRGFGPFRPLVILYYDYYFKSNHAAE